jgi:hypothetical protein
MLFTVHCTDKDFAQVNRTLACVANAVPSVETLVSLLRKSMMQIVWLLRSYSCVYASLMKALVSCTSYLCIVAPSLRPDLLRIHTQARVTLIYTINTFLTRTTPINTVTTTATPAALSTSRKIHITHQELAFSSHNVVAAFHQCTSKVLVPKLLVPNVHEPTSRKVSLCAMTQAFDIAANHVAVLKIRRNRSVLILVQLLGHRPC